MRSAVSTMCVALALAAGTGCQGREGGQLAEDTAFRATDTIVTEREVQDTTIVRTDTAIEADTAVRVVETDTTVTADTTVRKDTVTRRGRARQADTLANPR